MCVLPCPAHELLRPLPHLGWEGGDHRRLVDPGVPGGEVSELCVLAHTLPVGGDCGACSGLRRRRISPEKASSDDRARRQPLEIPLPRPWEGLVEVVDPEDEAPLDRAEDAEVRNVHIPAGLDRRAGRRRRREIGRHHPGRSTEECERRRQHARVAYGNELDEPCRVLRLEDRERVGACRRRTVVRVRPARHALAQPSAGSHAFRHGHLRRDLAPVERRSRLRAVHLRPLAGHRN